MLLKRNYSSVRRRDIVLDGPKDMKKWDEAWEAVQATPSLSNKMCEDIVGRVGSHIKNCLLDCKDIAKQSNCVVFLWFQYRYHTIHEKTTLKDIGFDEDGSAFE